MGTILLCLKVVYWYLTSKCTLRSSWRRFIVSFNTGWRPVPDSTSGPTNPRPLSVILIGKASGGRDPPLDRMASFWSGYCCQTIELALGVALTKVESSYHARPIVAGYCFRRSLALIPYHCSCRGQALPFCLGTVAKIAKVPRLERSSTGTSIR